MALEWAISGSYLEACNCEAICPCRRIGGTAGGRSTYGECLGALSWLVHDGYAGDADLSSMRVALTSRYHDDEPGSPWTYALFVDARGDEHQRAALADIFTGRLGGTPAKQFPWVFKAAHPVTCVIPGHHRQGRELISDLIDVRAGELAFSVRGRCAYESTFAYAAQDGQ